jgi:hypothetical protein
VGEIKKTNY